PVGRDADTPAERPVIEVTGSLENSNAQPRPQVAIDFALLDQVKQGQAHLMSALQRFAEGLGNTLDDLTSLEVSTYVSDALDAVRYENRRFPGAKLRAVTRVGLAGDISVCVPETKGMLDEGLWKIHQEMVKTAVENRTELLKAITAAATGLLS